jgi:hypothetical protein
MSIDTLIERRGAPVLLHTEGDLVPCPCRTPEGYRDPVWHKAHPDEPICNEEGFLDDPIELNVKGFVQPAFYGGRNVPITQTFGEIRNDDHIVMFPMQTPSGVELDFTTWTDTGADYILFNDLKLIVIGWSKIPDPHDASKFHHWELLLRRIEK